MPRDVCEKTALKQPEGGDYTKVAHHVNEWLDIHKGETFDLDIICRQLAITERENRKYVAIILAKKVDQEKLEKRNKTYRYVDKTAKFVPWWEADASQSLDISFPWGREDNSHFGFEDGVVTSPGDIWVLAGSFNNGKTTFCLNLLWENFDKMPCTLMGNEYTPIKFKRRVGRMSWADPFTSEGKPKFELIERRENWKDIIRPDNLNIIDWVNMGDEWYKVGMVIDGIQSKLKGGMAVIVLQKDPNKVLGRGGTFSGELASFYCSIDYQKLTVIKCKEWFDYNPNNRIYGFEIVGGGTKFHHIREIEKCKGCFGTGSKHGAQCKDCIGTGYVDIE